MGQELGRISGAMLKDNLLRQGIDLAFENDLLYLTLDNSDSSTHKVGINTDSIPRELTVNDSVKTTNLIIDNPILSPGTGAITLNGNTSTITYTSEKIVFPSDVRVYSNLISDDLGFSDNKIKTLNSNSNLEFRPTGDLSIFSDVIFYGSVRSTSENLAYTGNTLIGTIEGDFEATFIARINSDLLPVTDNVSNIGSNELAWKTLYVNELNTDELTINDTAIFTKNSNADLELSANSNGSVVVDQISVKDNSINAVVTNLEVRPSNQVLDVFSDTNIEANLYNTGNITLEGNIIFGNENSDTISFQTDFTSDILPTVTDLYNFGNLDNRWATTYIETGTVGAITVAAFPIDQVPNFALRQGKIWYVASLGLDTNVGNHQQGAYRTIKKALSSASAGDTVYIYPGEYEEVLPLTIPAGVAVRGSDIRQVIVKPLGNRNRDVFLLNGETSVEDLTVKDHLYNPLTDIGYAFRFAPNAVLTKKSPYVRNITVLSQGSIVTGGDPRGFVQGDAGRGALVDGSVVSSQSFDASMLFYSTTFIVPNAVGLYMKNGVRVEWLNSFTYFADISLLAENGSLGRTTNDGSTIKYGAELRSIASASVYGNYGAKADGADTLMYLINHNFAYIGTGRDASNDTTLILEQNQVIELNSGKINYSSVDQQGKFKVGDTFFVDLNKGITSIDASSVDVAGIQSVVFTSGVNETFADSNKIETGNLRLSGNRLLSENGSIFITSVTDQINVQSNITVTENLSIVDNLAIGGNLFFGNDATDTINFASKINSDLIPAVDKTFSIGSNTKRFLDTHFNKWTSENFIIDTNTIKAVNSNNSIEFKSSNIGLININDIAVKQSTISTDTVISRNTVVNFQSLSTSNADLTSTVDIKENTIFGLSNLDTVKLISLIDNDIVLNSPRNLGSASSSWQTLYTTKLDNAQLFVLQNNIQSTTSNSNIELQAAGSVVIDAVQIQESTIENLDQIDASVIIDSDVGVSVDFNIQTDLTVKGNIEIGNQESDKVSITAQLNTDLIPDQTNTRSLGSIDLAWNQFNFEQLKTDEVEFNTNYISTIDSNLDLILTGNNSGGVLLDNVLFNNNLIRSTIGDFVFQTNDTVNFNSTVILTNDLYVTENLSFGGDLIINGETTNDISFKAKIDSDIIPDIDNFYTLGSEVKTWKTLYSGVVETSDIKLSNNVITTYHSNLDLALVSQGQGNISIADIQFKENIISSNIDNDLILKPYPGKSLIIDSTKSFTVPVGVTADWVDQSLGEIRFNLDDNFFEGFKSTSNGILAGSSSDDKRTRVLAEPNTIKFIVDNTEVLTITPTNFEVNGLSSQDQILINNNAISASVDNIVLQSEDKFVQINDIRIGNSNIISQHNGAMILKSAGIGYYNIEGNNGVRIPSGTTEERPVDAQLAQVRFNTDLNDLEVYDGVTWVPASGSATEVTEDQLSELHEIYALIFG